MWYCPAMLAMPVPKYITKVHKGQGTLSPFTWTSAGTGTPGWTNREGEFATWRIDQRGVYMVPARQASQPVP